MTYLETCNFLARWYKSHNFAAAAVSVEEMLSGMSQRQADDLVKKLKGIN